MEGKTWAESSARAWPETNGSWPPDSFLRDLRRRELLSSLHPARGKIEDLRGDQSLEGAQRVQLRKRRDAKHFGDGEPSIDPRNDKSVGGRELQVLQSLDPDRDDRHVARVN